MDPSPGRRAPSSPPRPGEKPVDDAQSRALRHRRVERQIRARGVVDPAVLAAMEQVPRHAFVPADEQHHAYDDGPLPIGDGQTISQPYVVAWMTELCGGASGQRVLEIGTGCGYQAAVLAEVGHRVWSIEIVPALAARARVTLERLGYLDRVTLRAGDGYRGWPEAAPFDRIVLTAAPERVPEPLLRQVRVGGRMILPVGPAADQRLLVLDRVDPTTWERTEVGAVRFVPMTGEAESA